MELCQATLQDVCNLFFFYSYIWLWSILFVFGSTWRSYKSTPVRLSIRSFIRYQLFLRLDHRNFMNLTQRLFFAQWSKIVILKMWRSLMFKLDYDRSKGGGWNILLPQAQEYADFYHCNSMSLYRIFNFSMFKNPELTKLHWNQPMFYTKHYLACFICTL